MSQHIAPAQTSEEVRTDWDAQHSGEPWWQDWVRLRTLIETNAIPEARALVRELAVRWPDVPTIRRYQDALAPPEVQTVPRMGDYDPRPDYAWLRQHGHEYAGSWLAIYEGRLIAANPDLQHVIRVADAELGALRALLVRAPDRRQAQ